MSACSRNAPSLFVAKPQWKRISFQNYKHLYLMHSLSAKAFKGTVVNRELPFFHGGSLEITLTAPH